MPPPINRAPVRHTVCRTSVRQQSSLPTYKVPKEVIREIVQNRLLIGGKINCPTIEAPYGLYDINGTKVAQPGVICAYDYDTKVFVSTKGAEICSPSLLKEFNQHRDVLKLFACREGVQIWEEEEVKTGKLGPFLANNAVTRVKLKEFSELSESLKKDVRLFANILHIGYRFLKLSKEVGIVHTEHLPTRIYTEGPTFPHPEKITKGHAVFLKDGYSLPEAVLTELGCFNISKFSAINDPKQIRELIVRFYSEFNVIDMNKLFSFSNQYPFMGRGEVKVTHFLSHEASIEHNANLQRWHQMKDYVFLLHNL